MVPKLDHIFLAKRKKKFFQGGKWWVMGFFCVEFFSMVAHVSFAQDPHDLCLSSS
jgi:hypothetical protein